MIAGIVTIAAAVVLVLVVWTEYREEHLIALARSFRIPWSSHNWADLHTLYIWFGSDDKKTWINGTHLAVMESGFQIHPPWLKKWYLPSVEIPWKSLSVSTSVGDAIDNRITIEVTDLDLFLAIPNKFESELRLLAVDS
jgi:hypothetical protein